MDTNNARPVKTTQTSLRLLECVKERNGATLTELAEEVDLAKSTIHNHLSTLTNENFLVKEGQTFHVGLASLEYGIHARDRRNVYRPAKIQVYRLAESTNEEACFAVCQNGLMYTIEYVMGDANPSNPEAGSEFLKVGSKFYMHNSAVGKAVLAEYDVDQLTKILDHYGLPATTENTITDRDALLEELEAIRERGYATNDEELERGFRSIAVTVNGPDMPVIGSLLVGGPAYRFKLTAPEVNEAVMALLDAVDSVEAEIQEMVSAND